VHRYPKTLQLYNCCYEVITTKSITLAVKHKQTSWHYTNYCIQNAHGHGLSLRHEFNSDIYATDGQQLVLAQDSWCRRTMTLPSLRETGGRWRKDDTKPPVVGQCFEFPSVLWRCWWGDRKDIRPVNNLVPVIPKGSFPERVEEEMERNWLTQVHLENGR